MPSPRFNTMITQHCNNFSDVYQRYTTELFADVEKASVARIPTAGSKKKTEIKLYSSKQKEMIHNGEFGTHREFVSRILLRPFTPERYDIVNGFVINADGETSGQSDLLVCDRDLAPFCGNRELGIFYPAEAIAAIGEVKSKLIQKRGLNAAIEQLASRVSIAKQIHTLLSESVANSGRLAAGEQDLRSGQFDAQRLAVGLPHRGSHSDEQQQRIDALKQPSPQLCKDNAMGLPFGINARCEAETSIHQEPRLFSFLICSEIELPGARIPQVLSEKFNNSIEALWKKGVVDLPEVVLSVRDGLFQKPNTSTTTKYSLLSPGEKSVRHIKEFLSLYFSHVSSWKSMGMDIKQYIQRGEKDWKLVENELSDLD